MSQQKLDILKFIDKEPCSTKAVLDAFPGFLDRAAMCTFLGNLNQRGLLTKQGNGYWRVTDEGRKYIVELDSEPHGTEGEQPEAVQEPATPLPTKISEESSATTTPAWDRKEPQPADTPTWHHIQQLQALVSGGGSIVVEHEHVCVVIAGRRFAIKSQKDLDAALHVAGLYAGIAA